MSLRYALKAFGVSRFIHSRVLVSAIAWSVVYAYGPLQAIQLALLMILRDYLLVGIVVATILWYVHGRCVIHGFLMRKQVLLQSSPAISSIARDTSRFVGRMGLRF